MYHLSMRDVSTYLDLRLEQGVGEAGLMPDSVPDSMWRGVEDNPAGSGIDVGTGSQ
jgi:hypothetical protein